MISLYRLCRNFGYTYLIPQPDSITAELFDVGEFEVGQRTVHLAAIEDRGHVLAAINAAAHQDADLIQKSGIEESGIDRRAAHDAHPLYAKLFDEDLTCACKVDALRTAGNPRNVLSVQIVQVRYSCGTCSLVMMR